MIKIILKYLISTVLEMVGIATIKITISQGKTQSIHSKINMLLLLTLILIASLYFNIWMNYAT
jgi:hypothetical protein